VIKEIKHKGLRRLFEHGDTSKVNQNHVNKLSRILDALDTAQIIEDLARPGFKLHTLGGDKKGQWSIDVSGNWRVHFEFIDGDVYSVDYLDPHKK